MSTEGAASNMPERAKTHSMDAMEHGIRVASRDLELPAVESGSHATTACWRKALDNVVPACVVLKYGFGRCLYRCMAVFTFSTLISHLQSDSDSEL